MEDREVIRLGIVRTTNPVTLFTAIADMVRAEGFEPDTNYNEFRSPNHYHSWYSFVSEGRTDAQTDWHRDGMDKGVRYMALWASSFTTDIKLSDGTITRLKPFQVGVVDNRSVMHRTPAYRMTVANARRRYFARWNMRPLPGEETLPYLSPVVFRED